MGVRHVAPLLVVAALVAVGAAAETPLTEPRVRAGRVSAPGGRLVVGAAGDIACPAPPSSDPSFCQYEDTADLLETLDAVLALGDNQYDAGTYSAYTTYYHPTWGRFAEATFPVPGNHEYDQDASARPRGYFRYFGDRVKGPDRLGYYSVDLGACPDDPCWHVIALSSELCFASGGCGPPADPVNPGTGNRMYLWLQEDLAAHPNTDYPCTIAAWHHPLFSFSTGSGASAAVRPLWDLLYAARADVVLNGHSHNYQRWKPQDPNGYLDPEAGIRQFVVGTGGKSHYALPGGQLPPNLAAAQDHAFGVLRLTLGRAGYRWEWVSAAGQPEFTDERTTFAKCA